LFVEVARLCDEHIAFEWLCGGVGMNAKTLADFRVDHGAVLECLLMDSFTALVRAGVASLDRVAQGNGVRVRASAGAASFRRHSTLQERRGRKRYLGLVFTQLPSHLPDEVLSLINNWILHKLTDTGVVSRLKKIIPAVNEATWKSLPNLAPGQALCSFTHLTRPIMITVDPSPCKLRMVD
jgi:hypothetical protein